MSSPIDVTIAVHADRPTGAYEPLWNWFGYDEPNFTYTANGKKLLKELTELSPEPPRVRTHNLLTSGDGVAALKWGSTNAYTEDANGNPVYDWEAHARTGYAWWIDRLRALLAHVDVIRLDHFRAFAAAWHVPAGSPTVSAIRGRATP